MSTLSHDPEALLSDLAWMRRLATRLCSDPFAAEDLVQDTCVAALQQRWPTGRPTRAWLSKVIRNLAVSRHRVDSRRRRREAGVAQPEADAVVGQAELVARLEAQHRLARLVLELEEPARTMLLMRFQEELQPSEIATRLRLAPGTVRSRISRGLQTLRGKLQLETGGDHRAALAPILAGPIGGVVPLAGVESVSRGEGVAQSALVGTVTMKKILIASAAAVSTLAVWTVWPSHELDAVPEEWKSETVGSVRAASDRSGGAEEEMKNPAGEHRVSAGPSFGTAPGWWLEGAVRAAAGFGDTAPTFSVRDARGKNPLQLVGNVDAEGRAELSLAKIFRHEMLLTRGLRVSVDHPDYLPAHTVVPVDRRQRQDGFLGRRSRMPFAVDLVKATARVVGQLVLPDGISAASMKVALFRSADLADGEVTPVDLSVVDPRGSFSLRAESDKEYRLVAWSTRFSVRPTTRTVSTKGGSPESMRVELARGAAIRGKVRLPGSAPGVRFQITVQGSFGPGMRGLGVDSFFEVTETDGVVVDVSESVDVSTSSEITVLEDGAVASKGPVAFLDDVTSELRGLPSGPFASTGLVWDAAPFADVSELVWTGRSFEYGVVFAQVQDDGHFVVNGLGDGVGYVISDLLPMVDGRLVPTQMFGEAETGLKWNQIKAPAEGLDLDYTGQMFFTKFERDLVPVDPHDAEVEIDDGFYAISTDARGLMAMTIGGEKPARSRRFRIAACEPLSVEVVGGKWNEIQLLGKTDHATLTLHLVGDAERRVEVFHVSMWKEVGDGEKEHVDFLHMPVFKRIEERIVLRDLPPGIYKMRIHPTSSPGQIDFGTYTQTVFLDVELVPGGQQLANVVLRPAGYAELRRPMAFLSAEERQTNRRRIGYRLLDARDEEVQSSVVFARLNQESVSMSQAVRGQIPLGQAARFAPLLSPGAYVLETWTQEAPWKRRRTEFRIHPGEVTRLDPTEDAGEGK